ncbi:MAG: sigma-70 family RNA polymerase sigma factor [Lachnospiraceae bacterium]|nr:sigma-70 family RNA polymerase sigma factor [Lachnospiraceae bacterium]
MTENSRYEGLADEELIMRLRNGESEIADYICNKYKNLVRILAGKMFIPGADKDDLIQEGMIGLFKAVRDYDPLKPASFFTFAKLCIDRQMYTAIEAYGRKKNLPLNSYVSIYDSEDNFGEGDINLSGSAKVSSNPETMILDSENLKTLKSRINNDLSDFENEVLDLYLGGKNYREIAAVLNKNEKSVDNALNRIRNKVRKLLYT